MGKDHIEWVIDDVKKTIVSRGTERDQPDGERTIPRCVTAFNAITGHSLTNCDGWMFMEVLKQCRSVQGKYKYDDYRDRIGYAALAAEEARMENEAQEEVLPCDRKAGPEDVVQMMAEYEHNLISAPATPSKLTKLVVDICEHNRSNCYECKLFNEIDIRNVGTTGPPASDNRHDEALERDRAQRKERNELGCLHPYGSPCAGDCIDTRGGA